MDDMEIPQYASKRVLEQADEYDIVGYIEDDILIEDAEFLKKLVTSRHFQKIIQYCHIDAKQLKRWGKSYSRVILLREKRFVLGYRRSNNNAMGWIQ